MSWLFKKRRGVIDLTEHQKKAIVSQAEKTRDKASGYKDLTSEDTDIFSAVSRSASARNLDTASTNKLEDIEFKIDNLRKKVDDILNRLEVVEKKSGVHGY